MLTAEQPPRLARPSAMIDVQVNIVSAADGTAQVRQRLLLTGAAQRAGVSTSGCHGGDQLLYGDVTLRCREVFSVTPRVLALQRLNIGAGFRLAF
jgi:hypothetical protein